MERRGYPPERTLCSHAALPTPGNPERAPFPPRSSSAASCSTCCRRGLLRCAITVSWPLAAAPNWPLYANTLAVSPPSDPWIPPGMAKIGKAPNWTRQPPQPSYVLHVVGPCSDGPFVLENKVPSRHILSPWGRIFLNAPTVNEPSQEPFCLKFQIGVQLQKSA
jgi:hypothetical protein